ncbi:unnamed protein product [Paramecium octaurelia]|uniref:Transmembrane protein n=1 Tax=Paramecium octaurelia TaxID=43137 RepID=A0A8S1Y859_PAROT|nr:unnamed protein product [Paramecium octaurelia]
MKLTKMTSIKRVNITIITIFPRNNQFISTNILTFIFNQLKSSLTLQTTINLTIQTTRLTRQLTVIAAIIQQSIHIFTFFISNYYIIITFFQTFIAFSVKVIMINALQTFFIQTGQTNRSLTLKLTNRAAPIIVIQIKIIAFLCISSIRINCKVAIPANIDTIITLRFKTNNFTIQTIHSIRTTCFAIISAQSLTLKTIIIFIQIISIITFFRSYNN